MLKYAMPLVIPANNAASALSGVPPLSSMTAWLNVDAAVVSNIIWYVPLVTPAGNPGNDGVVVATPALTPGGAQQWMCAMVLGLISPLKLTSTRSTFPAGSSSTSTGPVPVELFGFSSA